MFSDSKVILYTRKQGKGEKKMAFRRPSQGKAAGINYLKPTFSDRMVLKATATLHARPLHVAYKQVLAENEKAKQSRK